MATYRSELRVDSAEEALEVRRIALAISLAIEAYSRADASSEDASSPGKGRWEAVARASSHRVQLVAPWGARGWKSSV